MTRTVLDGIVTFSFIMMPVVLQHPWDVTVATLIPPFWMYFALGKRSLFPIVQDGFLLSFQLSLLLCVFHGQLKITV